jgi:hypothetical protein
MVIRLDSDINLGLLFENFVRDYRAFGLRSGSNWTRHTTEVIRWFAQQGLNCGFHVEQEFHRADLVWFKTTEGGPTKGNVALHLESETLEDNADFTLRLLAGSLFPNVEAVIAFLHVEHSGHRGREIAEKLCKASRVLMDNVNRRMLLIIDAVWNQGDDFFGWIIEPQKSLVSYRAVGTKYLWNTLEYLDLNLTSNGSKNL